jgi:hypothetical protein
VVITLIIALPVSIALTGFIVLKSVQLGLRWQIQTQSKQEPTLEVRNPIVEAVKSTGARKQNAQMNEILDEYLNGAKLE